MNVTKGTIVDKDKRGVSLTFHPLTPDRWDDFERLFGKNGACEGCWCMFWRLSRREFESQKGESNHLAMRQIINSGETPGLLAYDKDNPVGWCAGAPRERYSALARSRVLKPIDEKPCWSVSCFFINKAYRKKGVATDLLSAAVKYVQSKGGKILEGHPLEPKEGNIPPSFAWTGIPKVFERAGFHEVTRHSPTRPIMRIDLDKK